MKNPNSLLILLSSIVVFCISLYSFGEAKHDLDGKKKEFVEYKEVALKYKENYQNYSDGAFIVNKLQFITKDLGIKTAHISQDEKKIIFIASNLSKPSFQVLFTNLLNENFNITKLEIQTNSISVEIGVL
jgi:hypothetical protein